MATACITLPVSAASVTDGAASNATPALNRRVGTESNPKKYFLTADFDAAADEHLWWTFTVPQDYSSGGTVVLYWMANATSGTCRWGARIGCITASDADTPLEHAEATAVTGGTATNATEARRLNTTSLDLSSNMDSAAAGDLAFLLVYRDGDGTSGTDDLSVDAELINVEFRYTTT